MISMYCKISINEIKVKRKEPTNRACLNKQLPQQLFTGLHVNTEKIRQEPNLIKEVSKKKILFMK